MALSAKDVALAISKVSAANLTPKGMDVARWLRISSLGPDQITCMDLLVMLILLVVRAAQYVPNERYDVVLVPALTCINPQTDRLAIRCRSAPDKVLSSKAGWGGFGRDRGFAGRGQVDLRP
jgi:hypothetical protein